MINFTINDRNGEQVALTLDPREFFIEEKFVNEKQVPILVPYFQPNELNTCDYPYQITTVNDQDITNQDFDKTYFQILDLQQEDTDLLDTPRGEKKQLRQDLTYEYPKRP
jgi:hypothetical protein